jgi:crossover junction endodeoxyribonuclease RuvC
MMKVVEHGTISTPAGKPLSECLKRLNKGICEIVERIKPEAVAIEGVFYCKNAKTALILGEARGTVIAVCASHDLPIYEYAPRKIKQAVVGTGSAGKHQVRQMVMSLLNMSEEPGEDESDALAIAICHLHNRTGYTALEPKRI